MVADVGFPAAIVGQLHAEADRDAARAPALGGLADDPLAIGEGGVPEGRRTGLEVDVVRDRQLGDAPLQGCRGVGVDRDIAVRRQVRVEVRVERQVPRLAIGHLSGAPPAAP